MKTTDKGKLTLNIKKWEAKEMSWAQSLSNKQAENLNYKLCQLTPNSAYQIVADGKKLGRFEVSAKGELSFSYKSSATPKEIKIYQE